MRKAHKIRTSETQRAINELQLSKNDHSHAIKILNNYLKNILSFIERYGEEKYEQDYPIIPDTK